MKKPLVITDAGPDALGALSDADGRVVAVAGPDASFSDLLALSRAFNATPARTLREQHEERRATEALRTIYHPGGAL